MGTYIPLGSRRRKNMADALAEAEQEHILDCPTADVFVRSGAFLLDGIFLWLMTSAIGQIAKAAQTALVQSGRISFENTEWASSFFDGSIWATKAVLLCLYLFWPVHRFGGTPGKLLLGLRIVDYQGGETISFVRTVVREGLGKCLSILSILAFLTSITGVSGIEFLNKTESVSATGLLIVPVTLSLAGFSMAYWRRDRRALHDVLSRSVVKKIHDGL